MTDGERRIRHGRRKRLQSVKPITLFLLCTGLVGFVLGVGLLFLSVLKGNAKLRTFGLIYVLAAVGILGVRALVVLWDRVRKRHYTRAISAPPV